MNKETLEHLSSLMDGELSRETGLFLTRRLSSDEALGQVWRRYHIIRDCMRQPGARTPVADVSQRVRLALAEESAPAAGGGATRRWLRPVSGLAIAATVALMAVIAVGPTQQATDTVNEASASPSFTSPNPIRVAPATQAASFSPVNQAQAARLNAYLLRHNQLAGSTGRQGFVSFVPIIAAETQSGPASADPEATAKEPQEETNLTP